MIVRDATGDDAATVAAIYAHHVVTGTATFETVPPSPAEIAARIAAVQHAGWPWLIGSVEGVLAGYAYCSQFRDRPAYRHTCESSIYLRDGVCGRGFGRILLAALLDRAAANDGRQIVAVIGDSGNAASIGLHAALGFAPAGLLGDAGFKFGRWLDVVYMQRALG